MNGERHDDSIVQRGIDEALACQDMLERTPPKPSLPVRLVTAISGWARVLVGHGREVIQQVAETTSIRTRPR